MQSVMERLVAERRRGEGEWARRGREAAERWLATASWAQVEEALLASRAHPLNVELLDRYQRMVNGLLTEIAGPASTSDADREQFRMAWWQHVCLVGKHVKLAV